AIAPGRLFFQAEPSEIRCQINDRGGEDGADIAFSLLAVYPGGRALVGHFGFNTEYRNYLNVFGPHCSVELERVFSITPELENELLVKEKNVSRIIKAPKADCFEIFLSDVFDSINRGAYGKYLDDLLCDAAALHKLRQAANVI
ncbi:MAG: gfo/Idh/MocA family oxidoreductase, partial [Candidatus Margulisbacteria bacterium]|nr:gfo/Idh/MocA family oxidoreductase [Candidatus Margulisiibacteriota bacterium]